MDIGVQDAKEAALEGQNADADTPEVTAPQQPDPAGQFSIIPLPSTHLHVFPATLYPTQLAQRLSLYSACLPALLVSAVLCCALLCCAVLCSALLCLLID